MLKLKILAYLSIALFLISFASAADVHGTVYDLSLRKLSNAAVEINTSPKQFFVAQNGSYSFNVPNGFYTIKARLLQKKTIVASAEENITISQDGSYVVDLILFPDVEEGVDDAGIDISSQFTDSRNGKNYVLIALISILILLFAAGLVYYFKIHRKQKKEIITENREIKKEEYAESDLGQIIKIIKNEGGRATQKEIRKQIPLSEAKVSLMIAELEHKEIVEKIKKGRGNIIILKAK